MLSKRTLLGLAARIVATCVACSLSGCGTTSGGSSAKAANTDDASRDQLKDLGKLALQVNPAEQIESIILIEPNLLEVTLRGPEGVRKVQFARVDKGAKGESLLLKRHYRWTRFRSTRMRPLRYSINVTLDGCVDHREGIADEELHRHAAETLAQADALIFGRVIYQMMEAAFRLPMRTAMPDWTMPFARTIDAAKKYVVSSTLDRVDWNAELVRGDLGTAVRQLKQEPGNGLLVGGVKLPLALAELGLIDDYEFIVHPRVAGHGPTLFAGLSKPLDLKLVSRLEYASGAVAMRYELRR